MLVMVSTLPETEQAMDADTPETPVQVVEPLSMAIGAGAVGFHCGKVRTTCPFAGMEVVGVSVSRAGPLAATCAGLADATSVAV